MSKGVFLSICFFLISLIGLGENILVSILDGKNINAFTLTIKRGSYSLKINNKLYALQKGSILNVKSGLYLSIGDSVKIKASNFEINGSDYVNYFEINAAGEFYRYDDDLKVSTLGNGFIFTNSVDLDHYVAGVVEGEAGYGLPLEYYKLQAILCRTYALKNINRHGSEGFDLCDKVHCQVYHNKCKKNDIIKATASTSGLIVVDYGLDLINTTFHSNCGGQTCNSEDVWITPVSYLRSVKDSFCQSSPHSNWEKVIQKKDFKTVFSKNQPNDSLDFESDMIFCQDTGRFPHKNLFSIRLTKIRSELNLRSTYFSIEADSTFLTFYGKGFGHGVGLCQEGGIEMSRLGYSYIDILKYYYTKVFIVNQRALLFFKED